MRESGRRMVNGRGEKYTFHSCHSNERVCYDGMDVRWLGLAELARQLTRLSLSIYKNIFQVLMHFLSHAVFAFTVFCCASLSRMPMMPMPQSYTQEF